MGKTCPDSASDVKQLNKGCFQDFLLVFCLMFGGFAPGFGRQIQWTAKEWEIVKINSWWILKIFIWVKKWERRDGKRSFLVSRRGQTSLALFHWASIGKRREGEEESWLRDNWESQTENTMKMFTLAFIKLCRWILRQLNILMFLV